MVLLEPTEVDISTMQHWFPDEETLRIWSGPKFRYPYTPDSFTEDLSMHRLASFSLKASPESTELFGFGQYYNRVGKCHLGRLVINPEFRGQNKISTLIELLTDKGCAELNTNQISLFVFEHNVKAKRAYENLGFVCATYPEPMPMEGCIYMVKQHH